MDKPLRHRLPRPIKEVGILQVEQIKEEGEFFMRATGKPLIVERC